MNGNVFWVLGGIFLFAALLVPGAVSEGMKDGFLQYLLQGFFVFMGVVFIYYGVNPSKIKSSSDPYDPTSNIINSKEK